VVLLGAATEEQVESNLRAKEVRLSAKDLQLLDGMRAPPEQYWSRRARLAWN
jgi:aryl-alcohol dehydrogenase-like predicted oxidoreductase